MGNKHVGHVRRAAADVGGGRQGRRIPPSWVVAGLISVEMGGIKSVLRPGGCGSAAARVVCAEPRVQPTTKQNKQESSAHWRYVGISIKIHKIPLLC